MSLPSSGPSQRIDAPEGDGWPARGSGSLPEQACAITDDRIACFDRDGAATIDTPLGADELIAASDCFDRLLIRERHAPRAQRTNDFYDQPLLDLLQHPFFEQVAKATLRSAAVDLFAAAITIVYPEPEKPFSYWEHVDIKYSLGDLDAHPRRMICSCILWLTDVTIDRAPMMFRMGSHRLIGAHMEGHPAYISDPEEFAALPRLPYAEPVPILARAGQVTVCTTGAVHGGSVNTGALERKAMFITFTPKGMAIHANEMIRDQRDHYRNELWRRLRTERRHIIPVTAEPGWSSQGRSSAQS